MDGFCNVSKQSKSTHQQNAPLITAFCLYMLLTELWLTFPHLVSHSFVSSKAACSLNWLTVVVFFKLLPL